MPQKTKKNNFILILIIIILVGGFFLTKKYLIQSLITRIEQKELKESIQLNPEIKKLLLNNFNIPLFEQSQYKNLEGKIQPLVIDNEGNNEPFKKLFINE